MWNGWLVWWNEPIAADYVDHIESYLQPQHVYKGGTWVSGGCMHDGLQRGVVEGCIRPEDVVCYLQYVAYSNVLIEV